VKLPLMLGFWIPRPAWRNELEHAHACPHCGDGRDCEVMICRGQTIKACWPCRQRGLE
jgi:hypothetical protein